MARTRMLGKLEEYIFYLFLFSIPFQTRKILWYSDWRFNEWLSISIYATDILLLSLFILWFFNLSQQTPNPKSQITNKFQLTKSKTQNPDFYLIIFLIISTLSIKNSSNYMISWFQWLKLVEFALFYFYLKNYALRRFDWTKSAYAIVAGGVFQAVIAIAQFFKQSSLGLGYLGESLVSVDLRGTAYFLTMTGEKIVRAYGTTPHPNVLAGYLLLVLSILYFIFCIKKIISCKNYLLFTISYGLILFAFFLTFSRIVIFAWAVAFMVGTLIYQKKYPQQIKNIFLITLFVILVFTILYWPEILSRLTIASGDEGLLVRKQYAQDIVRSDLTIFGVGIGNFVNWFSERNPMEADWLYQPVHNIYLLIYSETGLFGLSVFLLFLLSLIKESVSNKKLVFCLLPAPYRTCSCAGLLVPFLFVGFFDHFLWTLQQGRLIFWLVLTISSLGDIMRLQNFERR